MCGVLEEKISEKVIDWIMWSLTDPKTFASYSKHIKKPLRGTGGPVVKILHSQ